MELPRGTIRVENAMTEKRTHQPEKPLPYKIAQPHFDKKAVDGSKPFPNLSKSVAKMDCHKERKEAK